jgi:hypothetical protein
MYWPDNIPCTDQTIYNVLTRQYAMYWPDNIPCTDQTIYNVLTRQYAMYWPDNIPCTDQTIHHVPNYSRSSFILKYNKYIKIVLKYLEISYWGFRSSGIWSLMIQANLLKMMTLHSYGMSGTSNPITQHHIPEDFNPCKQCCENLKSHPLLLHIKYCVTAYANVGLLKLLGCILV